jgi:hypothetical protein
MPDCPLCSDWQGELDLSVVAFDLCDNHTGFMRRLDEIIDDNRELLGRLADHERLEFGQSLEQMRRRQGRVIRPEELREGDDGREG